MTPTTSGFGTRSTVPPPPRWAVWSAWAIPLTILPSAIWRLWAVFEEEPGGPHAFLNDGWYLVLLSALSMVLGLLSLGLVRSWGLALPRWVPLLGGRPVHHRLAAATAHTGGWIIVALTLYALWNVTFGNLFTFEPVLGPPAPDELAPPDLSVLRWYRPMIFWGPLLIALATDYGRRTAAAR